MALCFATSNRHKLEEVRALLPQGYPLLSLEDIGCNIDLPETQNTLEGNAKQKAAYVKEHYGMDCFADDTGLEVDALGGAPGVFSARYAGPSRPQTPSGMALPRVESEKREQANCAKLLQELKGKDHRQASFRTVICLIREREVHYFEGTIAGIIVQKPRGAHGFGYDPVFQPMGHASTFAQMSSQVKNRLSHRGKAIAKLVHFLGPKF